MSLIDYIQKIHKNCFVPMRFLLRFFTILILLKTSFASNCDFEQQVKDIQEKIKASRQILDKKSLEDSQIVKQHLDIMNNLDQETRKLFINNIHDPTAGKILEEIDRFHTNYLKAILEIHEWVTISKFGKEAEHQAWLLVQHADHDVDFQKDCLTKLKKLFPLGEADKQHYAYLYDRVATKFKSKQKYGTQTEFVEGQIELYPYEGSLNDLNNRRREMGMDSIEDYMIMMRKFYKM